MNKTLVYNKPLEITLSMTDSTGKLGHAEAFALFMDIAGQHAELLGIGAQALLPRNLFWLTVRTRVIYEKRPYLGQKVIVSTWPQAPGGLRCNRSYLISDEKGNVLVRGKTEWAVMDLRRQALINVSEVYPEDLQYDRPESIAEDFERISPEVWEDYGEYVVRSTDIDVGGHMNNVAYVRALLGSLSSEEIRKLNFRSLEVVYREPCYEKDRLQWQRSAHDEVTDFRLLRDGRAALLARMR